MKAEYAVLSSKNKQEECLPQSCIGQKRIAGLKN
jgi:hypothetical protein